MVVFVITEWTFGGGSEVIGLKKTEEAAKEILISKMNVYKNKDWHIDHDGLGCENEKLGIGFSIENWEVED